MNSSVNFSWQALKTDCRILWNQNFFKLWVSDLERRRRRRRLAMAIDGDDGDSTARGRQRQMCMSVAAYLVTLLTT
jgi:hypothetical protein